MGEESIRIGRGRDGGVQGQSERKREKEVLRMSCRRALLSLELGRSQERYFVPHDTYQPCLSAIFSALTLSALSLPTCSGFPHASSSPAPSWERYYWQVNLRALPIEQHLLSCEWVVPSPARFCRGQTSNGSIHWAVMKGYNGEAARIIVIPHALSRFLSAMKQVCWGQTQGSQLGMWHFSFFSLLRTEK